MKLKAGWNTLRGSKAGSLAVPVASLTGVTVGQFALPETLVIPANSLKPGFSLIRATYQLRRIGANAAGTFTLRLGTAGSASDYSITAGVSLAATNNLDYFGEALVSVHSVGGVTRFGSVYPNSGNVTAASDGTANINTAADMQITADMISANAADQFNLTALLVEVLI